MRVFGRRLRLHWPVGAALAAAVVWVATAAAAGPITINDPTPCTTGPCVAANASPFPSPLVVSGSGTISTIIVKVGGYWHDQPDDVDMMLESPGGGSVMLTSDAGDTSPIPSSTPITIFFKDGGGVQPSEDPGGPGISWVDGSTYKPSDFDGSPQTNNECVFFGPGDAGDAFNGSVTTLAALGTTANGTWNLKVSDDCGESDANGAFGGGAIGFWCLIINGLPQGCPATAVTVATFGARRAGHATQLVWRTGQETGVAGFNVYRTGAGATVKLNGKLVVAKGGVRGASYRLTDRTARRGVAYTYRLQVVHTDGVRTWASTTRLAR